MTRHQVSPAHPQHAPCPPPAAAGRAGAAAQVLRRPGQCCGSCLLPWPATTQQQCRRRDERRPPPQVRSAAQSASRRKVTANMRLQHKTTAFAGDLGKHVQLAVMAAQGHSSSIVPDPDSTCKQGREPTSTLTSAPMLLGTHCMHLPWRRCCQRCMCMHWPQML